MSDSPTTADSVRLALPSEAGQIAALQRRSWEQVLPGPVRSAMLDSFSADDMTAVWNAAITRPPQARYRVLVAVEQQRVVGAATTQPSDDPDAEEPVDGEVAEFMIDPTAQRRGHGSRLMHACVDTLRADGFSRACHWVLSVDDIAREFFTAAGWGPDGAHRTLGTDEAEPASSPEAASAPDGDAVVLKQVRLHTDISAPTD